MNWWRIKVSFIAESGRRVCETYAFYDTKDIAIKKAAAQLGPDWNEEGRVESVTKMAGAPFFSWRR